MKNKMMTVLALSALAAGRSSPEDEMRGQFLSGCAQSGADRECCNCVFEQVLLKFDALYLQRTHRTGE